MRKEVGYAIIAGVLFGLVVAYGVFRINSEVNKKNTAVLNSTPSPSPSPIENKEFKVVIDKPNNYDVITVDKVNVTGLTKKSAWVLINGEQQDYLVKSDTSGGFTKEVDLVSGVNQFKITAYEETGQESSANLTVIYSSSFAESQATESATVNATGEAALKQKVTEGLANVLRAPKAYIGTVTDVTDKTLELKTKQNDIQQISISLDGTAVVNATTSTVKNVKTADIAIGDFIVAMGFVQNNSVLNSSRILIITPLAEPKFTNTYGKITSINRKGFGITSIPNSEELAIITDTKTDYYAFTDNDISATKLANLDEDNVLLVTQTLDAKGNQVARTVFQITREE